MPTLSPFEAGRAVGHGRLETSGGFAYQLGDARRVARNFALGDYIELSQTTLLEAATTHITFPVQINPPEELPEGFGWELSAFLNGAVLWTRAIPAGGAAFTAQVFISTQAALVKDDPANTDTIAIRLAVV